MAFDETVITSIAIQADDADLLVTWTSSAAAGSWYQIYLNRVLAEETQSLRVLVPYPGGSRATVDVGQVAITDLGSDLSSTLPAISGGGDRAVLTWLGGTYLDASGLGDVKGFRVYGSDVAGGAIDYTVILADIAAYSQDNPLDGFGLGGFGLGGFGMADSSYMWKSKPLLRGTWNFGVKAYDHAGNLGTASTTSATITTAPRPPAPNANGQRLTRTYLFSAKTVSLNWLSSPG